MIGDRIYALRKSRGLTLEELAARVGTSKQTIHRYENGTITNIPPEKVEKLAAALGTSKQTIHRYENGIITNIPPEKVEKLANALGTTPSALMGWAEESDDQKHRVRQVPSSEAQRHARHLPRRQGIQEDCAR